MDIIEKLKQYRTTTSALVQDPQSAITELCMQLGGQIIDPLYPAVIRILKEYSYSSFLPDLDTKFSPIIHLPLLTKNEFSEPIPLNKIVMFDLETTGLAGGTGTYPFLLGFGVFTGEGIEIRQYFLPDYGRESIPYSEMLNCFSGKEVLVSFNGKSFDFPLLNNRFILNRIRNPFLTFQHLDLLHPARRIWKSLLESCSLNNIENQIFQFSRWNDISGYMIPQVYFDFVRSGNLQEILRVITHNQQDIITMGRLLLHFNWLEHGADHHGIHELELQNLCNLAISNFDQERSDILVDRLREKNKLTPDVTLTGYSLLLKRTGRWEEAVALWQELIQSGKNTLFAMEELAKFYEHRKIDIPKAKFYAERALEYLELLDELTAKDVYRSGQDQFLHRLQRLQRKMVSSSVSPDKEKNIT